MAIPHITVCVLTFQRQEYLHRLLTKLQPLRTDELFTYSVVVTDNDAAASARGMAASFPNIGGREVAYAVEPEQSIARARNKAVSTATGDYIAFIDDDEYPDGDWLLNLYRTRIEHNVAGVLGPVKPYFDYQPPRWAINGKFYERPSHPTGMVLDWSQTRTGNVLFKRDILPNDELPFRIEMGSAGSDMDFFRRMMDRGHKFVWCEEAVVFEVVPPSRCSKRYLLRRALLRGSNFHKHPADRLKNLAKSLIAVPCYAVALPFLGLGGGHMFLKYLIKICDHGARLLGFVGVHLVTRREM